MGGSTSGNPSVSVLIACPQHESKEYSFARWIKAVREFNHEILVVDTSKDEAFYCRWKDRVPMFHLQLDCGPNQRIALGMEHIRKHFISRGYQWWFNVESDIIPPPEALDYLLAHTDGFDWVTLPYKSRTEDKILENSFGCCLFSRKLMQSFSFVDAPADQTTDGWLYGIVGQVKALKSAIRLEHIGRD